ncbi:MAG: proton-conducting transporter membrane subunit [Cellulosilyticaceae bacterium]
MNRILLILPILLPILGGIGLSAFNFEKRTHRQIYVMSIIVINTILTLLLIVQPDIPTFKVISLTKELSISLKIDGISKMFACLVAILWPITTLYSFEYMKHEGKENKFFTYFTMTYGVVVGIAFSANLLTLYLFYELMTLITLPLVMHAMDEKARYAGKKYLLYSMVGAALSFIGIMFINSYGNSLDFVMGGVLDPNSITGHIELLRLAFVLAFFGFGVKAAVFPFHGWLPSASIAPTPVSALLHAVAVVKGGIFAIIRITYYSFGTEILLGSWAQYVMLGAIIITIVYGSAKALATNHLKRRLAYSTVSQLSYVLLGVGLMTPAGLIAGLMHLVFHAIMKICLFFCVGAIIYKTHREYTYQLDGIGKAMPITMACFAITSFGLTGIPPLAGFISKLRLGVAAAQSQNFLGYIGIIALMVSALLTVFYLVFLVGRIYFPSSDMDLVKANQDVKEANYMMTVPIALLALATILFGVYSMPIGNFFEKIVVGMIK